MFEYQYIKKVNYHSQIPGITFNSRHRWNLGGKNYHVGTLNFYYIFISLFGRMVSGVSVQDMLLRLPFMTPETLYETSWNDE